jgi:hypothetical protein
MIATAATNGAVVIWNIGRPGLQKQGLFQLLSLVTSPKKKE